MISKTQKTIRSGGTTTENEPIIKSDGASSDVMEWQSSDENSSVKITEDASNNLKLYADGGAAAAPAYSFGHTTSTGMYSPGANQIRFSTASTDRLTISSAGLATFSAGISVTTGGIKFPDPQSASADANTLDDYEEGTWVPTDGSGAGLTLATPVGSYTRVGRLVYVRWNVTYPTTSDGSSAQIGGLPFEPLTDWRCSGSNAYTTSSIATAAEITSYYSNIVYRKGGTSNRITNNELTGKVLRGSMTYEV